MSLSEVSLIDHMGTDLTVVNAARVSFGKKKTEFTDGDAKLIKYLADHNHWSRWTLFVQFHIEGSSICCKTVIKHQIGLTGMRSAEGMWTFHLSSTMWMFGEVQLIKKQGSSDNTVEWVNRDRRTNTLKSEVENIALKNYNTMIGELPEQARMILPQSMMTEWYWSGTLYAFT